MFANLTLDARGGNRFKQRGLGVAGHPAGMISLGVMREPAVPTPSLLDLPPAVAEARLAAWVSSQGLPAYRLQQLMPRLWQRPVARWGDVSDLPAAIRTQLDTAWPLPRLTLATEQQSADGTRKYLWRLA